MEQVNLDFECTHTKFKSHFFIHACATLGKLLDLADRRTTMVQTHEDANVTQVAGECLEKGDHLGLVRHHVPCPITWHAVTLLVSPGRDGLLRKSEPTGTSGKGLRSIVPTLFW